MKKCLCLLLGFFLVISLACAQKPVAEKAIILFQGQQPKSYALFNTAQEAKEGIQQFVELSYSLTIRPEILRDLQQANPGLVRLTLPSPLDVELDLYRSQVFSHEAMIRTSDGRTITPNPNHQYYRGMIHGNPNSLAVVSIFEDRIQILFADQQGNKRIQQTADGSYILFADRDITIPKESNCFVDDLPGVYPSHESNDGHQRVLTGNCVEVYVECDYKSYQDNGSSVANTEEWVGELWNEVITLYDNEDIPVAVSDIFVYTSTDPFAGLGSTTSILYAFANHVDTINYNGRLAHLLSTRPLGGGVAFIDVLCSTSVPCAFSSSLSTNIVMFPTYSWTVEVVTHEMGHNLGSQHTHACAWNNNNTQIDDCGNQWAANNGSNPEGAACYNPNAPIIPASGTIMSYCHLISGVGINFNNGFGPQPGDRIRTKYNNAPCNTGNCQPPLCTSLTLPAPGSINADINQDLFWDSAAGANGYKLTIGTSPTNGSILNNVDVGLVTTYNPVNPFPFNTTIYVKIVPYNNLGDADGCVNQTFTTEANVAPSCTVLTSPAEGATGVSMDAILYWAHSVGNQTGYKLSIGTTLNGIQVLNQLNVGNVTSYDHPTSFPHSTTLYVKITPYWTEGDITGCASQSFTTVVPIPGDFCTNAIELACGASIAGNTTQALPDPGLPSCVTSVDAPGLWYTFVGNGQNVVVTTCSQYNYDTKLNAYSGSCSNLVCVTGNDDFCNTGSLVTFATTNGTTYYILVQGWNGQQGSFTISRSCYSGPLYCAAQGNSSTFEWIKTVSLGSFTKTSGASSYSAFLNDTITVSRGGTYPLQLTPMFLQNPRNEYYKVWVDFNKDGDFDDAGEQIFSAGPSTSAVSGNITIPLTVATGNTRMRVAMRYNQAPLTCGAFGNGEVEDYTIHVKCNMVTTTTEIGNGSLRNVCACVPNGEPVLFSPTLNGQVILLTLGPLTATGAWKWMATEGSNIEIKALAISRILSIPVGKSAEIQNLKLMGGIAVMGSAIENAGSLILRDCSVYQSPGLTNTVIYNSGTLNMFGMTMIQF